MSEKEQKNTCILCGKEFKGYGNNPAPLKNEGVACNECNLKKVIPARIGASFGRKKEDKEN